LLALYATRQAADDSADAVGLQHVILAIKEALSQAQHSIRSAYHTATASPRRKNLYAKVLLACALASTDDLGYFAPADVRDPLSRIMKKRYEIPSFVRHLNLFCDAAHGPVLQKAGIALRYRYRFVNPLLQPFVIMQGWWKGSSPNRQYRLDLTHEPEVASTVPRCCRPCVPDPLDHLAAVS